MKEAGFRKDRPKREKVRRGNFSVPPGPSIANSIESKLRQAVRKYREEPSRERRGMVRGLAIAVATMRNPYDLRTTEIEYEFLQWDRERFGHGE